MDRAAAMMRTSRAQPRSADSRIIRAMRGSTGRRAILRPSSVSRSPLIALSSSRSRTPSAMLRGSGGSTNGNGADVAEARGGHLQDDRRQVGALDLGVGVLGAGGEVLLGVQPDADAVGDPAAAAFALVGARLGDGLDGQALHLGAEAVAADARGAGVDHVADAGDGERGFGDVGGQDDAAAVHAPAGGGLEDAVLFGGGQPGVQREDVEVFPAFEGVGGVADLALAGQEDEDVAGAFW